MSVQRVLLRKISTEASKPDREEEKEEEE